jgi:calcium-dependent protein kinase
MQAHASRLHARTKKLSSVSIFFLCACAADLKPENFVFDTPAEDASMRLIDFGCAKVAGDDEVIADVAGSPYYCSPEVLSESAVRTGRVWRAADMWSVGVIVFLLVCGYPPFNGDSQEKIFKKIKRGKFRFPKSDAEGQGGVNLSESVKSLITDLLQMAPSDRLTAEAALRHPWVSGDAAPDAPLPSAVVDALGAFRSKMRLKKAVARVLAHHMTEDDKVGLQKSVVWTARSGNVMRMCCFLFSHCCLVASSLALVSLSLLFKVNLAAVFHKFDVNGDGSLGASEIANLMRHIKVDAPEHEIQALMESMDEDGDGGVDLDEFATHVTLGQLGKDKAQIKATFDMFDLDHDGFVTHKVRLFVKSNAQSTPPLCLPCHCAVCPCAALHFAPLPRLTADLSFFLSFVFPLLRCRLCVICLLCVFVSLCSLCFAPFRILFP